MSFDEIYNNAIFRERRVMNAVLRTCTSFAYKSFSQVIKINEEWIVFCNICKHLSV